jgi:hypothetical protein
LVKPLRPVEGGADWALRRLLHDSSERRLRNHSSLLSTTLRAVAGVAGSGTNATWSLRQLSTAVGNAKPENAAAKHHNVSTIPARWTGKRITNARIPTEFDRNTTAGGPPAMMQRNLAARFQSANLRFGS